MITLKLIIAEKPELAEEIAAAIPGSERSNNGVIYKGEYGIASASGHLLTLKEPQDYEPELAKWDLSRLPIFFENWEVKPKAYRGHGVAPESRLAQIKSLIEDAELVIHAGDPDEEGQLLIDEILRWCECEKPVYRLATSDTTVPALKVALKNLTPNEDSEAGGWAAYARSVADMTFGINLSRYFTLHNQPATLTVGRVQSPTLGLVVARDKLIEGHQKVMFYTISAEMGVNGERIRCRYEPNKEDPNLTDGRILNESYAKSRVAMLDSETFNAVRITKEPVTEAPPLPVDLLELQSYCGQNFGYKPSQVLEITQTLRTQFKAITYNRSKCRYLSDNHFTEAPATMDTVINNIQIRPKGLDMTIRSKCFDSKKVAAAAHFAIIPQNVPLDLSKLTEPEQNVYLTIVKYYMAQFMPPAKKLRTKLVVALPDGGTLTSTSTEVLEKGYLVLFSKSAKKDEASVLSQMPEGTYTGTILQAKHEEKETKPPSRYTQTTLIKDMARIAKYVDDPAVKALLIEKNKGEDGENGAIGTPATRASIIDGLIEHGFLEEKDKYIVSTPLGRELIRILPDEAKKPDLTAYWWAIQEEIRNGEAGHEDLTDNVLELVRKVIHTQYPPINQDMIPASMKARSQAVTVGICPRCKKPVIEGMRGYGCSGWKEGCKFVLWKTSKSPVMQNVTFTAEDARKLLAGEAVLKKNLVSPKDGSLFSKFLILKDDPAEQYPSIVFVQDSETDKLPVIGECPRCGRSIVEKSRNFCCTGSESGCTFVVWKTQKNNPVLASVTFTAANMRDFLKGRPVHKRNLKSVRTGTMFEADLIMVDDPSSPYGPRFNFSFPNNKKKK